MKGQGEPTQPLPVSVSLSRVILVVRNERALHIPITVGRKDVEARAFIDSGATGIFISPRFVREHRLRTEPLPRPIPVFNVDGTPNKEALITRRALLSYKISGEPRFVKAYVASIGKEDMSPCLASTCTAISRAESRRSRPLSRSKVMRSTRLSGSRIRGSSGVSYSTSSSGRVMTTRIRHGNQRAMLRMRRTS